MPSRTFQNLNDEKKQRITAALLSEFSQHSLPDAEVARIIKQAGISRGAFYKYFADLKDAYLYLFTEVMAKVHAPITAQTQRMTAADYYQMVEGFVDRVHRSPYRDYICRHFLTNEGLLPAQRAAEPHSDTEWAVMTLCHAAINECLKDPAGQATVLTRLKNMLNKLLN
ncbi:MAG: TetR/AcrR family transcriptional regulator [Limosilactobacillus sp.]